MTYMAKILLEHLNKRPQRAKNLLFMLGLDPRNDGPKLRALVHELRVNGYPVCAQTNNGGGYWLGSRQDVDKTIADLKSRIAKLNDAVRILEHCQVDGQMDVRVLRGENDED